MLNERKIKDDPSTLSPILSHTIFLFCHCGITFIYLFQENMCIFSIGDKYDDQGFPSTFAIVNHVICITYLSFENPLSEIGPWFDWLVCMPGHTLAPPV